MTVCRYFQQGTCKFGHKCRFEHIKPNSPQDRYNEGGSFNSRKNRYDDSNSHSSNYIRPSQFSNRQQPQQNFSSPFNRQRQDSNSQFQSFPSKKDDRYHWSSSTSNRFAPLGDSRNESSVSDPNKEDQNLIQAVQDDVRSWTNSSMWPYSVYGAKACIDGLADIQPEELRALFYLHGSDTYKNLMRQVDDMYKSRKSELIQMSEETRMSILSSHHSNVDSNPSSCLTIFAMYGPGADFKAVSDSTPQVDARTKPIQPSPAAPVFQPPQVSQQPSESTTSQPLKSLFKSDLPSSKSSDANSRDCDVYTDESILTETELAEFKATSFTLGKIPMRPPPRSYCR